MNLIKKWALKNPTVQYWQQRLALRKLETVASILEKEVQKADRQDVETFKNVLGRVYECKTEYDRAIYNSVSVPAKIAVAHMQYLLERFQPLHGLSLNFIPQTFAPRSSISNLDGFETLQARAEQGRERIDGIERALNERYK